MQILVLAKHRFRNAQSCAHLNSLSVEAIERRGEEGIEGRREAVRAKILAENKVHV